MAPLVDYSDTDSEPDEPQPAVKRIKLDPGTRASSEKALPALPAKFYSLYATNARTTTTDDPSLHGGRTRQVAHKQGNWPTHIYVEWYPAEQEEQEIGTVINAAQERVPETQSFLRSNLGVQLPLHISLSAPLVLETEQRDKFLGAVQDAISDFGARSFSTRPQSITWVPNFDKTRYFLVLKLTRPRNDCLNKLLRACNTCARDFSLTELYQNTFIEEAAKVESKDDGFHISIAWTLDEPSDDAKMATRQLLQPRLQEIELPFNIVKLKIGNVVHDLGLLPAEKAND